MVEWAWDEFDEATADWCFQALGQTRTRAGCIVRRDDWMASGQSWGDYLRDWAQKEQLHPAETLLRLLDERFDREYVTYGAYFFHDLAQTSEQDEQAAIEMGQIRATRVDYVGRLREPWVTPARVRARDPSARPSS